MGESVPGVETPGFMTEPHSRQKKRTFYTRQASSISQT